MKESCDTVLSIRITEMLGSHEHSRTGVFTWPWHNGLISNIHLNINNESDAMSLDNEHIACEVVLSLGLKCSMRYINNRC